MQSEIILNYYWDIFLSHVCEFYPLEKEFIEKYEYELNWISISKNRNLTWDIDFLARYEDRFSWHELAWNESILWNEEKIDRFKKRLDWYYLSRNKNLPITEEFILKYSKQLFVVEDNPLLTKAIIDKYAIKVLSADTHDTQTIKEYDDQDFDTVFNKNKFHHNQRIVYEKVFLPIINDSTLGRIFESKFNYSQRYFFLEPIQIDIHGLTPEFKIEGENPFETFREGRDLFRIDNKLTLVNGSLQEGPDRLYEIPRLSTLSYYTTLLVSENVRLVLEQFKLPDHIYHEVNLVPKKLSTTTRFYILHISFDTLNKDLDFDNKTFYYSYKNFKNRGYGIADEKIKSHDELMIMKEKLNKKYSPVEYSIRLKPDSYALKTDYDLYSYSVHGNIIVNNYLKEALERSFPGQILFSSAQLLNISIDEEKYKEKAKLNINTKLSSKLSYRVSEEDQFLFAKSQRLENNDIPLNISYPESDKFSKKEVELNVIFPENFKNNYLNKKIKIHGYDILPVSKFYVQNEYAHRYPETFKSVAIAENGVGDSINLILERDSDYKLQNRLFEFFHETGEYEEI